MDPIEQFYQGFPRCNIAAALAPLIADRNTLVRLGATKEETDSGLLLDCFHVADRNRFLPAKWLPISYPPTNLYLLGCSMDLHDYDEQLTAAVNNPKSTQNGQDIPGCFRALFERLAAKYKIDIVIVDMNPSAWVVNKLIVMSCDFLIMPCSPDYYSFMAVHGMGKMLLKWDEWLQVRLPRASFLDHFFHERRQQQIR